MCIRDSVNCDDLVDGSDLSLVDNDSYSALTGRFLRSDVNGNNIVDACLLYTSPSPRDRTRSRMPSSA